MACWADEDDIVCIHPGGPRVVGAMAIRATFEAMFSNGSIRAWPERARKTQAVASAVHNVLERVEVLGPERPRPGLGDRHQRLSQDGAGLAHGGAPRQPRHPQRDPGSLRHTAGVALSAGVALTGQAAGIELPRALVAAGRQPADHLAGAVCAPRVRRAIRLPARALDHARRRLRRPRLACSRRPACASARAPLLVLFHGLEGSSRSHYAEAFADFAAERGLAYRGAAFPRLQRRAQPGAARLSLGRPRGDRLDPGAPARAARAARCSRSACRWAAMR